MISIRFVKKTIKSTLVVRNKEKQNQQKLNQLMQRKPDDGRHIVSIIKQFNSNFS